MEILIALVGGLLVLFFLAVTVFGVAKALQRRTRARAARRGMDEGTDQL